MSIDDKTIRRIICASAATVGISAVCAIGASVYGSAGAFTPSGNDRDIVFNKVHFSDDNDVVGGDKADDDKSALWEKDDNAQDMLNSLNNANYLFDNNHASSNTGNSPIINNRSDSSNVVSGGQIDGSGSIYDITGDRDSADTIISGGTPGSTTIDNDNFSSDDDNGGSGSGNDNNGSDNGNNGSDVPDRPDNKPDNKPDSKPDDKPDVPSDVVDDPGIEEDKDEIINDDMFGKFDRFDEGKLDGTDISDDDVVIQQGLSETNYLYRGQSVNGYTIFCLINTFVRNGDINYQWTTNDYGRYIEITGISFDGGISWNNTFPVTIPTEGELNIVFRARYRIRLSDEWTERVQEYPEYRDSRVIILSKKLDNDNSVISKDDILNSSDRDLFGGEYKNAGDTIRLYRYQANCLETDENNGITKVFPGWTENGTPVSWDYDVTYGRHVLEPMDSVPLDDKYTAGIRYEWIGSDYCGLQALTGINGTSYADEIDVPEYIQAVIVDDNITVDTMKVPSSVIYIQNDIFSGGILRVNEQYVVDDDNEVYSSDRGMLLDKAGQQILGIPYNMDTVYVSDNITNINIDIDNNIRTVVFEADSLDAIPELDYSSLNSDCKIVVNSSVFNDYIRTYSDDISENDLRIAVSDNQDDAYKIQNNALISDSGELKSIIKSSDTAITIPDSVISIAKNAFANVGNADTIILPDGADIAFDSECFEGSNIKMVICQNNRQQEAIANQFFASDILAVCTSISSEGYRYYISDTDVTLVRAPGNVNAFDGVIDGRDVTKVAAGAFKDCTSLEWVGLPSSVSSIGAETFRGCTNLEGVIIENNDSIYIGNKAFDDCDSLRYIASNAMHAVMGDDYNPFVTDGYGYSMFFVRNGAEGYGDNSTYFEDVDSDNRFVAYDIGEGNRMLYISDPDIGLWYAVRAGNKIGAVVELPVTTEGIHAYSFADTVCSSGSSSINLEQLDKLEAIGEGAFYNSCIGGHIVINASVTLADYAFGECNNVTTINLNKINYLGNMVFNGCSSLNTLYLGFTKSSASIGTNIFYRCDNLTDVTINSPDVLKLIYWERYGFRFNMAMDSLEEECEKLNIHIENLTEEKLNQYINQWAYSFAGYNYKSEYDENGYNMDMWEGIRYDLYDWDTGFPSNDKVKEEYDRIILENQLMIRKLFNMEDTRR